MANTFTPCGLVNKLAVAISLFSLAASVQAADDFSDVSLESLLDFKVVTASRKAESIKDAPSNVSVVTSEQIKNWGARDLNDVMRRIAGYTVVYDRDEIVYAARGNVSDNNQKYLILIDGHSMNSTENFGPGNIIELPNDLSNVKRIEIIKGPGSMTWGAGALAGVINIITKEASDLGDKTHVAITAGQNNSRVVNFQTGIQHSDEVDMVLMGAVAQSDGQQVVQSQAAGFPVTNGANGVFPQQYETLLGQLEPSYMLQMKARVGPFKLNAYAMDNAIFNRHFESDEGRENYLTNNKSFIEATREFQPSEHFSISWRTYYHNNKMAYEPFKQGTNTKLPSVILWEDTRISSGASFSHSFGDAVSLDYAFEYTHTEHGPNYRINNYNVDTVTKAPDNSRGFLFDPHSSEDTLGGYILGKFDLGAVDLVAGTWVDYNGDRGGDATAVSPRLAAIWTVNDTLTTKWVYNRAFLRPANFQITVNPEAESEIMDQIEWITLSQLGKASITATVFAQKLSSFLNIVDINSGAFEASGDYQSSGVELEGRYLFNAQHELWANWSYAQTKGSNFPNLLAADSRRVDPDGALLSYPEFTFNLGGTFRFGEQFQISPALRTVGPTRYRAIGAKKVTASEDQIFYLDNPQLYRQTDLMQYLDINATWTPITMLDLSLNVVNSLDETDKTHLTIWNGTIDQPGRYAEIEARLRF
jgi:outer membrane cobalamin receptor